MLTRRALFKTAVGLVAVAALPAQPLLAAVASVPTNGLKYQPIERLWDPLREMWCCRVMALDERHNLMWAAANLVPDDRWRLPGYQAIVEEELRHTIRLSVKQYGRGAGATRSYPN